MESEKLNIKIENIVASTMCAQGLNLAKMKSLFSDYVSESSIPSTLIFFTEEIPASLLLFENGRIFFTGANSMEDLEKSKQYIFEKLERAGIKVMKDANITIHNIIASIDLQTKLDLTMTMLRIGIEKIEHEPEYFPFGIYQHTVNKNEYWYANRHIYVLIFESGKLFLIGAKNMKEIKEVMQELKENIIPLNQSH